MKVRIIKDVSHGGKNYAAGKDPIEVEDDIGIALTSTGYAENMEPKRNAQRIHGATDEAGMRAQEDDEQTMRVRFRRSHQIGTRKYTGGKVERIAADEEGWEAVNVGACDLDPPPGVNGQPFPPNWVTESAATEAPVPLTADAARDLRGVPAQTANQLAAGAPRRVAPSRPDPTETPKTEGVKDSHLTAGAKPGDKAK